MYVSYSSVSEAQLIIFLYAYRKAATCMLRTQVEARKTFHFTRRLAFTRTSGSMATYNGNNKPIHRTFRQLRY